MPQGSLCECARARVRALVRVCVCVFASMHTYLLVGRGIAMNIKP